MFSPLLVLLSASLLQRVLNITSLLIGLLAWVLQTCCLLADKQWSLTQETVTNCTTTTKTSLFHKLLFIKLKGLKAFLHCIVDQWVYVHNVRSTAALTDSRFPQLITWLLRHFKFIIRDKNKTKQKSKQNQWISTIKICFSKKNSSKSLKTYVLEREKTQW